MPTLAISKLRGINENPGDEELEDAYNVEFRDGRAERLRGLELVNYSRDCKPARVIIGNYDGSALWDFNSGVLLGEFTGRLTDGDTATLMSISGATTGTVIFVGMPFPFRAIRITMGAVNIVDPTPLSLAYTNRTGWVEGAIGGISNGTLVGGASFGQSGILSFANGGEDWIPTHILGYRLYWQRIRISAGGPLSVGTTITEIRVPLVAQGTGLTMEYGARPLPNGLYVWQRPYKGKRVFVGCDAAGYFNGFDAINVEPQRYTGAARLIEYDENDSGFRAVELPYAAFGSHIGARWVFAAYGSTGLVATNGFGPPVQITDSAKAEVLKAVQGEDRLTGAYLGSPPWGSQLASLGSRLVIAGGPVTPYTVWWTHPADGPLNIDLAAAPLGGANHWPSDHNVDVGTDTGHKITGLAVAGQEVIALTADSIWRGPPPYINKVAGGTGCDAGATVQQIGPVTFFKASEGFYSLVGAQLNNLSKPIEQYLNRYALKPQAFAAHSVNYRKKTQIHIWLEGWRNQNTSNQTQIRVIYDYRTGAWSKGEYSPDLVAISTAASVGAACAYETDSAGEVLYLAGLVQVAAAFNLWTGDSGYRNRYTTLSDAASSVVSPLPVLVTRKIGIESAARFLARHLWLLMDTTGASIGVTPLFDNAEWRSLIAVPSDLAQTVVLSEPLDPQLGTTTGNHAATIDTDRWRGRRQVWQRTSFARKCEYVQFYIAQVSTQRPLTIRALELDWLPVPGKPPARLR